MEDGEAGERGQGEGIGGRKWRKSTFCHLVRKGDRRIEEVLMKQKHLSSLLKTYRAGKMS